LLYGNDGFRPRVTGCTYGFAGVQLFAKGDCSRPVCFVYEPFTSLGKGFLFGIKRMKNSVFKVLILLYGLFLLGLSGCGGPSLGSTEREEEIRADNKAESKAEIEMQAAGLVYESSMELRYAENFSVDYYKGGYTLLTTVDGSRFLIVPEEGEVPEGLLEDITVLKRPIGDIYLVASAVMDMFSELDSLNAITLSGQKEDGWYIEQARDAMARGEMVYAGKYNKPDYELIVSEHCSLAIENTMITHSPEVVEKLNEFGIPVLIEYSSSESHPLGRVEWIKFFGALLGREAEAERAFEQQETMLEQMTAKEKTDQTVAFFLHYLKWDGFGTTKLGLCTKDD